MRLKVHNYGDPVLRAQGARISEISPAIRRLAEEMVETMHAEQGVGLAAQQVGHAVMLCVVYVPAHCDLDEQGNRLHPDLEMPMVLINPEITRRSEETERGEEGCLSFPGISGSIPRAREITVRFQDLEGRDHELRLRDFVARVVQHEVDHLNGVLFIDHMTQVKRLAIAGQLKRLRRESLSSRASA